MAMKENFLREVKIGDKVELMIGSKEMSGQVIALDLDTVRIRRENGKEPVLSLDAITYFEASDDEDVSVSSDMKKEKETNDEKTSQFLEELKKDSEINEKIINSDVTKITTMDSQNCFFILKERGDTFFENVSEPVIRDFMDVAKSSGSNDLIAVADSLNYAFKKEHELSPADYKIQENVKKLNRLINSNNSKIAANMLGALYFQCKSDRLALDTYKKGDDNESAFAIAQTINSTENMEYFACHHLIDNINLNAYIVKWLFERMIITHDYSIIDNINTKNIEASNVDGYLDAVKAALIVNNVTYK